MKVSRLAHYAVHPAQAFDRAIYGIYSARRRRGIRRFLRINPNAIILASYPKSGNTLFRLIWLKLLALQGEVKEEIDYALLDALLPNDQFLSDLDLVWKFRSLPCLLKTHLAPQPGYHERRIIHVVRNPLDTMVSNFHYFSARTSGPRGDRISAIERRVFNKLARNELPFSEFLKEQFPYYLRHLDAWLRAQAIPIAYERLTDARHAEDEVHDLLAQLGIPIADEFVGAAVAETRAEKMKDKPLPTSMAALEGVGFVRDARSEQWRGVYGEVDLDFVRDAMANCGWSRPDHFPDRYRALVSHWPSECFSVRAAR